MRSRWGDPKRVFLALGLTGDIAEWVFYLPAIVWWTVDLEFSPLQLVGLGTALEVTVLVAEVPTGVVADRWSRKWSIVASHLVMGAAMVLAVVSLSYPVMLVAQALFALGWTFRSGADIAWLTDEITDQITDREAPGGFDALAPDVSPLILRRHRIGLVVGPLALVPVMIFGRESLRLVIAIAGCFLLASALVFGVVMSDAFRTRASRTHIERQRAIDILRGGIATARQVRPIRMLVITMVLLGAGAESLDRLGFKHFLDIGDFDENSIVWMGVLFIALGLAGAAVIWFVEHRIERDVALPRLGSHLLIVSAVGALTVAVSPIAGIAIGLLLQDATREAFDAVSAAWTNAYADEASRATVHSLVSQAHGVGEVLGGLTLAAVAQATSITVAVAVAGALWASAALTSHRTEEPRRGKTSQHASAQEP